MVAALTLAFIVCLLQGALCGQFQAVVPQTIEVLQGSCVTIPCSFDIQDQHNAGLDSTCIALWKYPRDNTVFDSSNPQQEEIKGELLGVLTQKDCTTTLNDMKTQYSRSYFVRLQCHNLKYSFSDFPTNILVRGDLGRPTLTPPTLKVKEGTSVSLTCSAPAPCLPLPPNLTWSPGLGEGQETLQENQDKTKVKVSVLNFTASHLHHRQQISCTAVYGKQDGSTELSVNSTLTADVTYSPKSTTVSVSPSGPVQEGSTVTLTCSSSANPAVQNYTWYRVEDSKEIMVGTGQVSKITTSPDSGPFFCQAENEEGRGRSNNTHIDVQYSPKDTKVSVSPSGPIQEGSTVTLTCSSSANPAVKNYTWYTTDGDQETFMGTGPVLNVTVSRGRGSFFCKTENEVGAGKSNISQIEVQYSPKDTKVSVSPSGPIQEGSTVTLTCSSSANPAVKNYTWYTADGDQETFMGTGPVLNVKASRGRGSFICKTENEVGAGKSNISQIEVQFAPQILPSSYCTKTVNQVNCSCEATGNPPPNLDWTLDGSSVNRSGGVAVSNEYHNGTNVSFITMTQTQWKDQFALLCKSSNFLGSDSQQFLFYGLELKTSSGSGGSVILEVFIATTVVLLVLLCALVVLVCALFSLIRTHKIQHNLLKSQTTDNASTVGMSQLLPSGDRNEEPNKSEEAIYANSNMLRKSDVTKPPTTSADNQNMPSSGKNNTDFSKSSDSKIEDNNDVVYTTVTWKSKGETGGQDSGTTNLSGGPDQREMMGENVERKTVCEYAQVKFKEKSGLQE